MIHDSAPRMQIHDMPVRARSGSIILIVIGTLFCLFLFAFGYSRFLSQQSAMADKLSKKQKLGELAAALATLTAHKLQFSSQTLPSPSTKRAYPEKSPALKALFDYLSQPLAKFASRKEFAMPLIEDETAHFSLLLEGLWQASQYGNELVEYIKIVVFRKDFTSSGPAPMAYTLEKSGQVKICINLKLLHGSTVNSSVDFDFACPVRVSSVHAPVLSKFNLYIEDARLAPGNEEIGYNQVSVDTFGNIAQTRSKALPLVLNNDDNLNLPVKTEFRNFVEDARGLVYLGGSSKIFLNLARSDVLAPNSDSGEGFQFFRRQNFDGTYPVYSGNSSEAGKILISFMDQGVSDDPDNRNASFYTRIISGYFGLQQVTRGRLHLASLFRLFGTQSKPSPTLVLGKICSQFLTIAMMNGEGGKKVRPPILDNLSYAPPMQPDSYYFNCINLPEYTDLSSAFTLDNSPAAYLKYITRYASRIRHRPYNQGLGFILSQENPDAPLLFPESDLLSRFVRSSDHADTHKIPGIFATIFPETADLKKMSAFTNAATGLARISYEFANTNTDALTLLARQNLLSRGRLAINGWVKFKNSIKFDRRLEYLSSAGIIVEKGDIIIESSILPYLQRDNCLLYLVALNGNVVFNCNPDDRVQAAIIANADEPDQGRVIFNRPPAAIRGSLAMKKLVRNHDEAAKFKGTGLTYFAPLAAKPAGSEGWSNDGALLSYSFGQFPQEVR